MQEAHARLTLVDLRGSGGRVGGDGTGETKVLRDYLLRGGFLMADDLHGQYEWEVFARTMHMTFPDRPIQDIADDDSAFHTVYDIKDRYQVPGWAHLRLGYKRPIHQTGPDDGKGVHWRGIYDDKGRLMVAISYNSDLGDAWEWADDPRYPTEFADLAVRLGVNYIVYAMPHYVFDRLKGWRL